MNEITKFFNDSFSIKNNENIFYNVNYPHKASEEYIYIIVNQLILVEKY